MSDEWDRIWEKLEKIFARFIPKITTNRPGLASISGRTRTPAFPFGAYLSFSRSSEPGNEDIVVSIDCRLKNSRLICTSDISRENGFVLLDGPSVIVETFNLEGIDGLDRWVDEMDTFLSSSVKVIREELEEQPIL